MSLNLLVITNNYPDEYDRYIGNIFVKEQLNYIRNEFKNIFVVSPIAYGMGMLRHVDQKDYEYDNISVFFPRYFNFPPLYFSSSFLWANIEEKAIRKLIDNYNIEFDLIHAHFTWPSGAAALNISKVFRVPLVITEHTSQTFKRAIDKRDRRYVRTWSSSDSIIRVSKSDISCFESLGIEKHKISYIPNGYDSNKFYIMNTSSSKEKLNLPLDKKIILCVGSLIKVKGYAYLIKALKELLTIRSDFLCLIIGAGRLRSTVAEEINLSGLQNNIRLIGEKPHNEIPIWINACDIFVLPSLSEGNPTVMFECLGCGKPFIGTKVGGIPDVIKSDEYGFLCEPMNSNDLFMKIMNALEKDWDRTAIRQYAEQFSWENIAKIIVNLYKSLLAKKY